MRIIQVDERGDVVHETSVNQPDGPKSLSAKLAKIAAEIGEVPKSGHNSDQNYDYATETDIVLAVRQKLFAGGVMLFSSVQRIDREAGETKSGGKKTKVTLSLRFTFVDGESGESWTAPWISEAEDTQDKAVAKALTNGLKYFLRDTFLLATGDFEDEIDNDGKPTGRRLTRKERKTVKQAEALRASPPRAGGDQQAAFARLHSAMGAVGCKVPRNTDPTWPDYIGWLRKLAEQVQGGPVKRLADLSAEQLDAVTKWLRSAITAGEVNPWGVE